MNPQANYIVRAILLLFGLAIFFWFISKIAQTKSGQKISDATSPVIIDKGFSELAMKGKTLFMGKCASCHALFKDMTGPGLSAVLQSERWSDRKKLYEWIKNPEAFMKTDPYTRELKKQYGSMMTAFTNISDEEIDAIVAYILEAKQGPVAMPVASLR